METNKVKQTATQIEETERIQKIKTLRRTLSEKIVKLKSVIKEIHEVEIEIHQEFTHKLKRRLEILLTLKRSLLFEIRTTTRELKKLGVHVHLQSSISKFLKTKKSVTIRKFKKVLFSRINQLKVIRREIHQVYLLYMESPTERLRKKLYSLRVKKRKLTVSIGMIIEKMRKLGVRIRTHTFKSKTQIWIKRHREKVIKDLIELRHIRLQIMHVLFLYKKHRSRTLKRRLIELQERKRKLSVKLRLIIAEMRRHGVKINVKKYTSRKWLHIQWYKKRLSQKVKMLTQLRIKIVHVIHLLKTERTESRVELLIKLKRIRHKLKSSIHHLIMKLKKLNVKGELDYLFFLLRFT